MREDQIFIDHDSVTAYTVDHEFKIIYGYDCEFIDGVYPTIRNEGIMQSIDINIASKIEQYFHIDISEFSVELLNEKIEIDDKAIQNEDYKLSSKQISSKKSYDKALQRMITTIIKINQNELPNTKELAEEFNVSKKTIQNDIYKRLSYLPIHKKDNRFCFPDNFMWNHCLKNKKG